MDGRVLEGATLEVSEIEVTVDEGEYPDGPTLDSEWCEWAEGVCEWECPKALEVMVDVGSVDVNGGGETMVRLVVLSSEDDKVDNRVDELVTVVGYTTELEGMLSSCVEVNGGDETVVDVVVLYTSSGSDNVDVDAETDEVVVLEG